MRAKRWILVVGIIFGMGMRAHAQQVSAPSGWSDESDGALRIFTKSTGRIEIGPWENLQGASIEQWLDVRKSRVPAGVQLISSKAIKKETSGSTEYLYVNQRTKINGKGGSGVVIACPGAEGAARLLRMDVESTKFGDAISGGRFIDRVCGDEPKGAPVQRASPSNRSVASNSSPNTPSLSRSGSAPHSSSTRETQDGVLPPVQKPDGLIEVRGMITFGIQPGGMFGTTEDFVALFDDGAYSRDLPRTFGASKAESKAKRPKYWGQWRKRDDALELKGAGDQKFSGTNGDWRVVPGSTDHKLSGCFSRLTSSSSYGYSGSSTIGLARSWCFYPNGRFTNSATSYGSSSDPGIAMSASDAARGRYRIDGNAVRFVYDNGRDIRTVFGYLNKDKTHILLNGERFMGGKKR